MNIQKFMDKIHAGISGNSHWYREMHAHSKSNFRNWMILAFVTATIGTAIFSLAKETGNTLSYAASTGTLYQAQSALGFAKNQAAQVLGTSTTSSAHGVGSTVLLNGTVYYIDYLGEKRPYTSWGAFLSYAFNSPSTIVQGNADDAALPTGNFLPPQDGSLINDNGTVYIISKGARAGFASASTFTALGYKFANVLNGDTSFLPTQNVIKSADQGHLPDSLVLANGTVYLLTTTGKVPIPSEQVFSSWGYSWKDVIPANTYDLVAPVTPVILQPRPAGYTSAFAYVNAGNIKQGNSSNATGSTDTNTNNTATNSPAPTNNNSDSNNSSNNNPANTNANTNTDTSTNTNTDNGANTNNGSTATSNPGGTATRPADTTAPSAPTTLASSAIKSTTLSISWNASTDNVGVAGYNIYRNGTKVGAASGLTYSDNGLTAATAYSYTVAAYDAAGNISAKSATLNVTTAAAAVTPPADTTAPTVPAGLAKSALTSTSVTISWTVSTDSVGVTGYNIYRNTTKISTSGTATFTDSTLTASTTYSYTVSAYDAAGNTSAKSTALSVTTPAAAIVTTSPVSPAPSNLPAHPRVWITPARITQLKAQVAANSSAWQKVKSAADAQLVAGASADPGLLPVLCLAYLGNGNIKYAQRAGDILTVTATTAEDTVLRSDDAYPYRTLLPQVSEGLDWCYNGLTVAQRQQSATWLMDAADWIWTETNPSRVGAWGVAAVTNNYYWGFMMTGPAALAAAGDDTGTGTVSGTNRPAYHIALAINHWNTAALPYLNSLGVGGAGTEGTGYDISGNISLFADAFETSGTPMPSDWYAQTVLWHLEYTMPGGLYFAPLGDQARISDGPMYIYNRENMLEALAAGNISGALATQAQAWLSLIGEVPYSSDDGPDLAKELLYYNPSAPIAANLSALPKTYLASGTGDFVARQNWTDNSATTMVFESGSLAESHISDDANGLMIWKNGYWITASANIYSHSGIEQPTVDYNNMTVGGNGQANSIPADSGQIVNTQSSDSLMVVRGQAANAYGPADARPVSDYLRTVAYLPQQDAFVVVDRVTVADPSQQKVFRWQSEAVPAISGKNFTLVNPSGSARCFGSVALPSTAVLGTQAYDLGVTPSDGVTSNAVTITLPTGQASAVLVTILQCTTGTTAPNSASATSDGTNVTATIGSTKVVVPLDQNQQVTVQ